MKNINDIIQKNKEYLQKIEQYLWKNPEIGYKEWKTSSFLCEEFRKLGFDITNAENIPGFSATLDTQKNGPCVAILGELDALLDDFHIDHDPSTHAVHSCGHHGQLVILLGCAIVLKELAFEENICGKIKFIAVPAEETIDLEYRNDLINRGIINYVAGKVEFLHRGFFDDVDMSMMIHLNNLEKHLFTVMPGYNGCLTKQYTFVGKASHAGIDPENGINAMYAASLSLSACNSLRETFRDEDHIRFHPIITQAGMAVNSIPQKAYLEAYVRASTVDSIISTNQKINQALAGAALAMNANVIINDRPGNMPVHNDYKLISLFEKEVEKLFGYNQIEYREWDKGCTDIGDISTLMPVLHAECTGAMGQCHGIDFHIDDFDKACINPIALLSSMCIELLSENAQIAIDILETYQPVFKNKEEYFKTINAMAVTTELICYKDDEITINLPIS